MRTSPSILLITTQTWFQITRVAMRFLAYGAKLSVLCPEESQLVSLPRVERAYRFQPLTPLQSLHQAIVASGAEYLLPADDLAVLMLHEIWERAPELRGLIERSLGDSRHHAILRSRPELLRLAAELGIATPETRTVWQEHDLEQWFATHRAPAVIKRDGTWGGRGVCIAQSPEEAERAFETLQQGAGWAERVSCWLRTGNGAAFVRLRSERTAQITVQNYIEGVPANAMFACHEGRILGGVQAKVLASIGKTGPSLVVRAMHDQRIARAAALLADALQLSGFFGLDFILDKAGTPYLLEINPRLTRLAHLGPIGAPDLAGLLWCAWTGQHIAATGAVQAGDRVAFFPDGVRLQAERPELATCHSDLPAHEQRAVSDLLKRHAGKRTRLQTRAWQRLARTRKALQAEPQSYAFFHPEHGAEPAELRLMRPKEQPLGTLTA